MPERRGEMPADDDVKLIQQLFDVFSRGDVESILAALTEMSTGRDR